MKTTAVSPEASAASSSRAHQSSCVRPTRKSGPPPPERRHPGKGSGGPSGVTAKGSARAPGTAPNASRLPVAKSWSPGSRCNGTVSSATTLLTISYCSGVPVVGVVAGQQDEIERSRGKRRCEGGDTREVAMILLTRAREVQVTDVQPRQDPFEPLPCVPLLRDGSSGARLKRPTGVRSGGGRRRRRRRRRTRPPGGGGGPCRESGWLTCSILAASVPIMFAASTRPSLPS